MSSLLKFVLLLIIILTAYIPLKIINTQENEKVFSENEAIEKIAKITKSDHLYSWINEQCLSFIVEERTQSYFSIAIRENHNPGCSGDPDTAPVVDRFHISRITQQIFWWNFVSNQYEPYNPERIRR